MKVVAALIENGDKVLIAKRSNGNPSVLGKWEFPGGKVELGESDYVAIEREMKEEFEVVVKAKKFLGNVIDNDLDLRLYLCDYVSGEFKLNAHSEYRYVLRSELSNYDLAPLDIKLLEYVV